MLCQIRDTRSSVIQKDELELTQPAVNDRVLQLLPALSFTKESRNPDNFSLLSQVLSINQLLNLQIIKKAEIFNINKQECF